MKSERYMNEKMAWSTMDEIAFLNKIGKSNQVIKATKKQMLEGYLKGIEKRVNFGSIGKPICKQYAIELLRML